MSNLGQAWPRLDPYRGPYPGRSYTDLFGPLELVTPPAGQIVTLAEAKAQARVEVPDEDATIYGIVDDATEFCEREVYGERAWVSRVYRVPLTGWWTGPVRLPLPPCQALVSVGYYDTTGTLQTVPTSTYLVRTPWRQPGEVELAPGQSWPAYQWDRRYPVQLTVAAGYGPSTRVAASISAGVQVVTPDSMAGIYAGTRLRVGDLPGQETVIVSAVGATTFTATFAQAHTGPVTVQGDWPRTARRAVLLVLTWMFESREPEKVDLDAVERLLAADGWGSYA